LPHAAPGRAGQGPVARGQPDRDRGLHAGGILEPRLVQLSLLGAGRSVAPRLPAGGGSAGRPATHSGLLHDGVVAAACRDGGGGAAKLSAVKYVLSLRHRVADFDAWKSVFDQRLDARVNGEVTGHRLTRGAMDPNEVEVAMEFASRADAQAYREYMDQRATRQA